MLFPYFPLPLQSALPAGVPFNTCNIYRICVCIAMSCQECLVITVLFNTAMGVLRYYYSLSVSVSKLHVTIPIFSLATHNFPYNKF